MSQFSVERIMLAMSLLGFLLGLAWVTPALREAMQEAHPINAQRDAIIVPGVPSRQTDYASVMSRPLFNPSRRPTPVPSEVEKAELVAPAPILRGILGELGHEGVLLEDGNGSRSRLLRPHQSFAGWEVVSVGARHVQLRSAGMTVQLALRNDHRKQQADAMP